MKHLICLLMSFISLGLHSQNVITYRYDASGNRISRLYKSNANSKKIKKSLRITNSIQTEKKSAPSVSYISSTDKVSINLPHQKIGSPVLLNIYTLSGILIFSCDINQGNCTVSLSSVPAGTYIADIEMSTEHYSLKFTKE